MGDDQDLMPDPGQTVSFKAVRSYATGGTEVGMTYSEIDSTHSKIRLLKS